jgi:choline monooxygenase
VLLEGCLDEPLVLAADEDGALRCLSNVCTHRGNLVVGEAGTARSLRCRYHGRRFGLDGRCLSMPEFRDVAGFPSPSDDLAALPLGRLGPLVFTALEPGHSFEALVAPVRERLGWLRFDELRPDEAGRRDYHVAANWLLYCDNYLEGFHIPFVHAGLSAALDFPAYRTETLPLGVLQVGAAAPGEPAFELPDGHPDGGQAIAAYYFWLFPATMLNFYPWGLSVNAVRPLGPDRTRVTYASYVWRPELQGRGAGADLDRVEMEDEEVVEAVQRGVRSRLYDRGRYSPTMEAGVHHFHRLLAERVGG